MVVYSHTSCFAFFFLTQSDLVEALNGFFAERSWFGFKYGLLQHYPFVLHLNVMLTSIYEHPSTAKSSVLWAEVKGQNHILCFSSEIISLPNP